MYTFSDTLSISNLRKHTDKVFQELGDLEEAVTVFSHSKPVGVLMSLSLYERLRTHTPTPDKARAREAIQLFLHPPKRFLLKKGTDPVALIRSLRD